ncbi:tetratricopeptide repeat protein [Anaeromyxobacter terrae]|uniref:tetratricopeptide repeat protein n=1 Tax=Anaeromyxobacter terrae TaxID=2925406 RepID=UPI001F582DD2|nr:tetratricopeptide repeat protein [Anaeromyxobacter sp. SG22]
MDAFPEPTAAGALPARPPRSLAHAAALVALAALAAAAYANALGGAFVFDDVEQIRDAPLIRDLANYLGSGAGYRAMPNRWVGYLTLALNHRLGGLEVTGYHLFNVGVHALNGALVYALVVLTFRAERLRRSSLAGSAPVIALVSAALFIVHPIQTQAVTYVVQRFTSLATLFYLAAVVLYGAWRLRRERGEGGPSAAGLYAGALACAVLAMRTKEIAFTLPFAIVLYELAFFGPARRRWTLLLPFIATAAIIPLTNVDLGLRVGETMERAASATRVQTAVGRLDYLRTEIAVVVTYVSLLLLPIGQSVDHEYPIYTSFAAPEVALSLAVLAVLAACAGYLAWRTRRDSPRPLDGAARLVAFCIGWWFLTLSVESSVIPIVDVINEHRVYLPSVGFFVAAGVGIALLGRRLSPERPLRAALVAGALLAAVLAVATHQRNLVWTDAVSLWADAASKAPGKARPHHLLGAALVEQGRRVEALGPLRRAIALDPSLPWPREQLGATLLALGRADEAEPELREALRLRGDYPEAAFNLAVLLSRTGRTGEAKDWFRRFLDVAPAAYNPRARALAEARVAGP